MRVKWGNWVLHPVVMYEDFLIFAALEGGTDVQTELFGVTATCDADDIWEIGKYTNTIPEASDTVPKANGIASAGSAYEYARADHTHPSEVFVCTFTFSNYKCLCNKTFNEIKTAYEAGKICIAKYQSDIYYLNGVSDTELKFYSAYPNGGSQVTMNNKTENNMQTFYLSDWFTPKARKVTLTTSGWSNNQ